MKTRINLPCFRTHTPYLLHEAWLYSNISIYKIIISAYMLSRPDSIKNNYPIFIYRKQTYHFSPNVIFYTYWDKKYHFRLVGTFPRFVWQIFFEFSWPTHKYTHSHTLPLVRCRLISIYVRWIGKRMLLPKTFVYSENVRSNSTNSHSGDTRMGQKCGKLSPESTETT